MVVVQDDFPPRTNTSPSTSRAGRWKKKKRQRHTLKPDKPKANQKTVSSSSGMLRPGRRQRRRCETHDDACTNDLALNVPWELVAQYLHLNELLHLRLCASFVAMRLHEGLGRHACSRWLEATLHHRNFYLFNQKSEWAKAKQRHEPTNSESNANDDDDDSDCLLGWMGCSDSSLPLDQLLGCLRIFQHIPRVLVVGFSGKFGRHCWSFTNRSGPGPPLYASCHRGKRECPTCRTTIQRIPIDDNTTTREEATTTQNGFSIDDVFRIPVTPKDGVSQPIHRLRLDVYHNKCIPNLPPDLLCPCCRVSTRRTLLLTEFSYQTEPGTERRPGLDMMRTFTPSDHHNSGAESVASTHALPSHEPTILGFPPLYHEGFFPGFYKDDPSDVKRGIAIHCEACEKFGVLAPALLTPIFEGYFQASIDPDTHPMLSGVAFASATLQR